MTNQQTRGRKIVDDEHLTPQQRLFVIAYCSFGAETYQNATKSILVSYHVNSARTAEAMGSENLRKPSVKQAIERRLHLPEIDDAIVKGILARLADPNSPNWQPTADYVSKIRGDFL